MNMKAILQFALLLALASVAQCSEVDNVYSADVVRRLSPSTVTIHARRLPEADFTSLTNLTKLENLHFSRGFAAFPAQITDAGLAQLVALKLQSVRFLDLGFCSNITDDGLTHVAKMRSLTGMAVTGCLRITDNGLKTLVTMTNLTMVNLEGCSQISERSLDILATKTNWQTIKLGGCKGVTIQAVARLQAKIPSASIEKNEENWNYVYGRLLR
jgi:hypothetical protein